MKYRTDFVTNSSSSSFIIALKNSSKEIDSILLEWAKKQLIENAEQINSIEQLNTYFMKRYAYFRNNITLEQLLEDEPYLNEKYIKCKTAIENGSRIIFKTISCEGQDEHLEMFDELFEMLEESPDYQDIDTDLSY